MKINNVNIYMFILLALLFTSCEYDNFEGPNAMLSGKVVYDGQPIGVRTNGTKFELWQDGYALKTSVEVFIGQDGTYSASLFEGQYKMVRRGGAPWQQQPTDTIVIDVKGATEYDVPVTPYFVIENENFEKQGNILDTSFQINKIVDNANLDAVNIYFNTSILTDSNHNRSSITISDITLGELNNRQIEIPEALLGNEYLFVRIGVKSTSSGEFCYTQVQKIFL